MSKSEIKSPLPGVFYRSSSPEEPNYKEVGDTVKVGDVIGLVEVMKTYTEVKSEFDGTITSFATENEDAIMPGQVLVELET
ncbi:acetyl-CoA carboxylase [Aliiroseovarius subalbicans]|uniref:acetyl-CoA carboxylase n=1 Tax=Aliiroseovarius subalbicans TaxID=2925840 RepID=UPI001F55D208|nr:acetyl-CoA carboxylase [Aliiroseovarius subalbicans]MCI2400950.1 acetyl-CoA carboxylase [Aliiroseovarius subalbicans]